MATVTRSTKKLDPAALVVAVETWTADLGGEPVVVRRGDKFRADAPEVARNPEFFVADPGEADKLPPWDAPGESKQPDGHDAVVNTSPVPLEIETLELQRDARVQVLGGPLLELEAGTRVERTHELVRLRPEWFGLPAPEPRSPEEFGLRSPRVWLP